ncbi:MAG: Capsular polysaccharide export system periplasmic protein KpsD [uncultured Sulfurovum sp.]|uniref:Capsular polysaccharide export system periplasmic protein KpsD n=1 Tax=uncultured Sulfurovum sp. TaxID=269237 RepID=A0A6S6SZS6_9BACT|nr:MAG: Capsular polysaccharide export system periplasmic protein KpsD [uncultured Sulfurovum sp.]
MKYLFIVLMALQCLLALEVDVENEVVEEVVEEVEVIEGKPFFGEELFTGNFKANRQFRQNSNYVLNVNDKITVKMWGTHNYIDENLTIDKQGNIFIPEVGAIHLLGLPASSLQATIKKSVHKVFNDEVKVYADVQGYQAISVYVTGSVKKVGLYEGLSTDSVLQFIDKSRGILRGVGSFRTIQLIRNGAVIQVIDLYDFLLTGNMRPIAFQDGDTLFVQPIKYYVDIEGDVLRPYIFELLNNSTTVSEIIAYALPTVKVNNFTISNWSNSEKSTKEYSLEDARGVRVQNGDNLVFNGNYYTNSLKLDVTGEHKGKQHIAIKKGTSLYEVLSKLEFSSLSDIRNIKLYKEKVALVQQSLLNTKLKELEQSVLTADSSSAEEAKIRESEAGRILQFIAKARKVKLTGQLVLDYNTNLKNIILEEGDSVVIPTKSNFVVVDGEVNIPNALVYETGKSVSNYIDLSGGFSERADTSKVLLIKANGKALFNTDNVDAGDSILVLREIDTKNTIWIKDITQILYQIAVGAAVALQF